MLKSLFFITGIVLLLAGYRLLAVPPDAALDETISRVKNGMFLVITGGGSLMVWLVKR